MNYTLLVWFCCTASEQIHTITLITCIWLKYKYSVIFICFFLNWLLIIRYHSLFLNWAIPIWCGKISEIGGQRKFFLQCPKQKKLVDIYTSCHCEIWCSTVSLYFSAGSFFPSFYRVARLFWSGWMIGLLRFLLQCSAAFCQFSQTGLTFFSSLSSVSCNKVLPVSGTLLLQQTIISLSLIKILKAQSKIKKKQVSANSFILSDFLLCLGRIPALTDGVLCWSACSPYCSCDYCSVWARSGLLKTDIFHLAPRDYVSLTSQLCLPHTTANIVYQHSADRANSTFFSFCMLRMN